MSATEATISVGVGAVVLDDDGRILLVKHVPRRGDFWGGQWMVPGGGLELGETLEQGVVREVEEETNLKVEVLRHVSTLDRIVREGDEVKIHVVYVDFLVRPIADVGEIEVGRHGLVIVEGQNQGVLLPQVATEQSWDRDEFLRQICLKAGLPEDAWQEGAQLYVFTAEVFGEER